MIKVNPLPFAAGLAPMDHVEAAFPVSVSAPTETRLVAPLSAISRIAEPEFEFTRNRSPIDAAGAFNVNAPFAMLSWIEGLAPADALYAA
jgi:hypothetical protein